MTFDQILPSLKEDEGIIFKIEADRPVHEVQDMCNGLVSTFPGHPVICIPENYDIEIASIDKIIKYLESFKEKKNNEN